jgi:DNA helicase-2/ATP-dependent DNA helicase PcrA
VKNDTFKKKYESLNKEQKEAVDSINGPVMVIAGPGTGKTSVLTLRIANILRLTDTLPESILALTFTESGAISMRNKLFEIIGESAFRVKISTFHGFANEIIQNYPEYFPKIVGGNVASSLDKVRIIEKIIESNNFKTIKPSGDMAYYVKPIEKAIGHLKSEGFDAKSFSTWLKKEEKRVDEVLENKFLRSRELSIVFELYEKEMSKLSLYDYDDMLIEFIKALENHKNLLLDLEENYLYIMADEHQDANNNQNKILELLTSYDSNPNLFIVGDENQSIFRFQGASLENFLYFKNRFKKVKVINLIQNYRSSQKILDASFELINNNQKNSGQKIKLLSNHKKEGAPIFLREFENDESEFNFIAQEISNLTKDNPDEKIAVIYRSNDDTLDIVRKLDKMGIGFSIKSDDDIFTDIDIDNLITFLKAIDNPLNSEFLSKVLFFDFLKIPTIPALKAIKEVGFENNLIEILNNPSKLNLNKKDEEILKDFSHHLLSWSKDSKNLNLEEFIDKLVRESGFANKILAHKNTIKKLDKFRGFYSILRSTVQSKKTPVLGDFLSDLNLAKKFDLKFESSVFDSEKANVFLMTAHKSKGLEFDTVFLIKGNEEKWSKKRDKELFLLPLKGNLDNDDSDEKIFS